MTDNTDYEVGSGNVFKDLGLSNPEEKLAKAKLALKIIEISKQRGLTQKKMAILLKIDQPKVSALYNGRLSAFSISRLLKFLMLLEQDIDIIVKDKAKEQHHFGHLKVVFDKDVQAAR